jgi:hypothetical protein
MSALPVATLLTRQRVCVCGGGGGQQVEAAASTLRTLPSHPTQTQWRVGSAASVAAAIANSSALWADRGLPLPTPPR